MVILREKNNKWMEKKCWNDFHLLSEYLWFSTRVAYIPRNQHADLAPMMMNLPLQWQRVACHFYCHFDERTFRVDTSLLSFQMSANSMFVSSSLAASVNVKNDLYKYKTYKQYMQIELSFPQSDSQSRSFILSEFNERITSDFVPSLSSPQAIHKQFEICLIFSCCCCCFASFAFLFS